MTIEFEEFPKMARLSRRIVITEKLDGTNAQVCIGDDGEVKFGSRTRWITPEDDNFGFARWATDNVEELRRLGPGRHFGEWWGAGIGRRYDQKQKFFSLFNTLRWNSENLPSCCLTVPILFDGLWMGSEPFNALEDLRQCGSIAAPGFMKPEGIIIYHVAGNTSFKKTLEKDEMSKWQTERAATGL